MGSEVIFRGQWRRGAALVATAAALAAASTIHVQAHKPITSRYTFNRDVLPIVREHCAPCHVDGGVAPMSLMTAADATPWAESIRVELVAGRMPPWRIDTPSGRFRNEDRLTGRELDVLLTWATGGTPPGDPVDAPPTRRRDDAQWPLGKPDVELTLEPVTIPANQTEIVKSFVVPTGIPDRRFVRAVDLLPGTPAIVRSARIAVQAGDDGHPAPATNHITIGIERTLALWLPGESPVPLEPGIGFELPAGAPLAVQVRYRKTWQYEGKAMDDQSRIGIYFAASNAEPVRTITLQADADAGVAGIGGSIAQPANGRQNGVPTRVIAIEPDPGIDHTLVSVELAHRDHSTSKLMTLRASSAWVRRYWLAAPVALPPDGSWDARFEPYTEPAILAPSTPAAATTPNGSRAVTLDVVDK